MEGEVYNQQFVVKDNADKVQDIIDQFAVDNLYKPKKRNGKLVYTKRLNGLRYFTYSIDGGVLTVSYYMKPYPRPFTFLCDRIVWLNYAIYELSLSLLFRELVKISESSTYEEIIKKGDEYIAAGKPIPADIKCKLLPPMPDKVEKIPVRVRRMLAVMSLLLSIVGVILYMNRIYMSGFVMAIGLAAAIIGMASKFRYISAVAYVMDILLMAAVIYVTM